MKKNYLILGFLILSGCSSNGSINLPDYFDNRPDYKQSRTIDSLTIPPTLSRSQVSNTLALPSGYKTDTAPQFSNKVADKPVKLSDALKQIKRQGDLTWIEIDDTPDNTFNNIKHFWQRAGLKISTAEPSIGIIETDWLEREPNLPKSGIASLISKFISNISDDGKRDRFRTRVDFDGQNTLVYVTHYGATQEVFDKRGNVAKGQFATNDKLLENTIAWTEGDRNPELEIEMLRRISVYLLQNKGTNLAVDSSHQTSKQSNIPSVSLTSLGDGTPAIVMNTDYNQAWVLLGIAIDRAGLDISSSQRSQGSINVTDITTEEIGFFVKETERTIDNYNIAISDQGDRQIVVVRSQNRHPANNESSKVLLKRIIQPLR